MKSELFGMEDELELPQWIKFDYIFYSNSLRNSSLCGFQFARASGYRRILTFPPEITNLERLLVERLSLTWNDNGDTSNNNH